MKKNKKVKYGIVGNNPSRTGVAVKQKNMIGSNPDKTAKKARKGSPKMIKTSNSSFASNKSPKFMRESTPNKRSKTIRGEKVKYELQGQDPGNNVNKVKEKRVYDVQFRSAYKFDKNGRQYRKKTSKE